jgi:hypothetical protein
VGFPVDVLDFDAPRFLRATQDLAENRKCSINSARSASVCLSSSNKLPDVCRVTIGEKEIITHCSDDPSEVSLNVLCPAKVLPLLYPITPARFVNG